MDVFIVFYYTCFRNICITVWPFTANDVHQRLYIGLKFTKLVKNTIIDHKGISYSMFKNHPALGQINRVILVYRLVSTVSYV